MSSRIALISPALALVLAGCIDRGDWKPAPQLTPQGLAAQRALAGAQVEPTRWPADTWWRGYGDPQLDGLIEQALAGSPSLEIAQARLRAAQGQAIAARAARLPTGTLDATVSRQRFPENGLYPPPYGGNYWNQGQVTLDFRYDLDLWGHYRELAAAARAGVAAAQADQAAARLAIAVAVVRAYIQLDLWYALRDVANDQLKQQQSLLDLTRERVAAGLENSARVKQSEGNVALTRAGVEAAQASIDLARDQLADVVGAGPIAASTSTARILPPRRASCCRPCCLRIYSGAARISPRRVPGSSPPHAASRPRRRSSTPM